MISLANPARTLAAPPMRTPARQQAAWPWVRRLLDADSAARVFTITPERYSPARTAADLSFYDYDGDGTTIRFGDGTFGRAPGPGTTFRPGTWPAGAPRATWAPTRS